MQVRKKIKPECKGVNVIQASKCQGLTDRAKIEIVIIEEDH